MLVSVIIPTYNRADYLRDAVESALAQTFRNFEILIVDDGSTDCTSEVAASYRGKARYLTQQNSGPAAARNNGIRNAAGRYIAFLDSDDVWLPEMLSRQISMFQANPTAGLAATGYRLMDAEQQISDAIIMDRKELEAARKGDHYKNFFATSGVMVKKECFQSVGLFNENLDFAEDWDMWLRILQHYGFVYLPEVLMHYRVHPAKISAGSLQKNMKNWQKVIDIHSSRDNIFNYSILKRKRISWLYLNHACAHRGHDPVIEKKFMWKSIVAWPLWFPGRYSFFLKRLGSRHI